MAVTTEAVQEKAPLHVYPEATTGSKFFSHHGIYSLRYNGVCALTGSTVLMASGRFIMFVDVKLATIKSIQGPMNGGVGAFAVHPSRRFYVVCEKAPTDPLIRAYSWPSNRDVGQFVGGSVSGFSACCFNADGSRMATVGLDPDYSLAVWDWATRCMILRNRCHNTDVHTVCFSTFDSGVLVSGGAGHIKFWSMAKTFTGMKLQGMLGKFGRLEISNVSGFVVLADGRVLSGSECGLILLWEGDLVRCCFARVVFKNEVDGAAVLAAQSYKYTPCHDGTINVVELLGDGQILLTAADDGYMRYWRVSELETAEGEGAPPLYAPECLCEVLVAPGVRIRALTLCHDVNEWVVLDSTGALWRVPYLPPEEILAASPQRATQPAVAALRFNGGGITSAAMSPWDHTIVTGGEDGSIRLIDYVTPREVYKIFASPQSVVVALRFFRTDTTGMKFIACFENGTIWLLQRGKEVFALLGKWRPHEEGLKAVAVDHAERRLCTVSTKGTAFFFDITPDLSSLNPIGFCCLPLKDVQCIAWDDETSCCLVGHECGKLLAIRAPLMEEMDHTFSFEFTCSYALVGIRQRKKVEKKVTDAATGDRLGVMPEEEIIDDEEEEDTGPWPIRLICRLPDDTFAIGSSASELLYQYTTHIRYDNTTELPPLPPTGIEPPDYVEEPMVNLCYRDLTPQSAFLSASKKYLTIICEGAQFFLRPVGSAERMLQSCTLLAAAHDRLGGHISAAGTSFDDTMVVSVGLDGLVVAQILDGCVAPSPPQIEQTHASLRAEELVEPKLIPLSISEQKEADNRRLEEEAKQREVDAFLEKLQVVHAKYAVLWDKNNALPPALRLSSEEMALHPQILRELEEEKQRRVNASRQEHALELAREEVRTKKLRNRFIDNLLYDRFQVHSFSKEFAVSSFRTPKPDRAIQNLEALIQELLLSDENGTENKHADNGECNGGNDNKKDHTGDDDGKGLNDAAKDSCADVTKPSQTQLKEMQAGSALLTSAMQQYFLKMEDRREERRRRKQGYEELMSQRPEPATEAAELAKEMQSAVTRRGECVLRTDPSYGSAPSAIVKLQELIKLEKHVMELRSGFTKKLLVLRDEKAGLCVSLNKLLSRIREINEALKEENVNAANVSLLPIEIPEQRFVIDRDGLDAFAKQKHQEKVRQELAKKAQRGFGADLAVDEAVSKRDTMVTISTSDGGDAARGISARFSTAECRSSTLQRTKTIHKASVQRMSRAYNSSLATNALRERMDYELRVKLEHVKQTEAEEEEQQMEGERLVTERRCLQSRVDAIMKTFDRRLWQLYEERANVDADLCLAHARSLLMFNEYRILLVFRQKDRELRRQYEEAKSSRDRCHREVVEIQKALREKAEAIEKLQEVSKAFRHEVEYFIETHFPAEHVPYIMKVFLRQIKRRKHHGDVSLDDDDITSDDDEEEMNDDELMEEACPPNCLEEDWLVVLEKRETRLDYADAIAAGRREQELMQRRIEEHTALGEQQDTALTMSLKAIEDFQSEKRKQLNMLETLVALRCSQVKCLDEEGKCPDTFVADDLLVISDHTMTGLRRRIETMAEEKQELFLSLKNMVGELQRLQHVQSTKTALHAQWEAKVYEAMLLKFGQVVDLERLESTSGCREVEELKERLRIEEVAWERELRKRERKIAALRSQLQSQLVHNTHLLHELGDQESDRHDVEWSLSQATRKVVSRMYDGSVVATAEDRRNLKVLIAAQQEEIDALRAEVDMLRRKGGHVYAPLPA